MLDGIDLAISPSERVGLVGPSGARKETLVNLLGQFYTLQGGRISIGAEHIAMVTRETSMVHRSISNNTSVRLVWRERGQFIAAANRGGDTGTGGQPHVRAHGDRHAVPAVDIARMDRLVVLEQGRIVEMGSDAELLSARGAYPGLSLRRSGGFQESASSLAA